MTSEIPTEIDLALRKHVERAVRPVQAGGTKKLAMREELHAHLTAIYLEELQQQVDPRVALESAFTRFGEPPVLTAELNSSLSRMDRFNYYDGIISQKILSWFIFHREEPWYRIAFRWVTTLMLVNACFWIMLLSVATAQARTGDASGFSAAWRCSLLLSIAQPAAILGIRGVYLALTRHSKPVRWLAAIFQAIAWSVLELLVVLVFWWSFTSSLPTADPQMVFVMRSFLILLPPSLFLGGWLCTLAKPLKDKHAAWTSLTIDE